ncbi:alpha/beta hydrolase [Cohnella candidum]|uniref:Esterase n=1 Tax=Cohnella candidum TaxID=2674991 RepID=A0A3G3JYL9_9BACL|nr:alpha/beta hydrolase-fold protein [Cohnella candidum]AYQ72947.1 esterase [Cohnella candidum]
MRKLWIAAGAVVLFGFAAGCGASDGQPAAQTAASSQTAVSTPAVSVPSAPSATASEQTSRSKPPSPSRLEKVKFHSKALNADKRLQIYLPPGYDASRRYPVLYLLHGYFGTESAWMPEMQTDKAADRLIEDGSIEPLIIVAPEMDNSYGLNSSDAYRLETPKDPVHSRYYGRYEDYMVHDVIGYVDSHYSTEASKKSRYIGGYSMGGFASLHIAFRHPDLFSKVGGHSPALWTDWSSVPRMKSWLYPTAAERKRRDPVQLARTADLSGMSVYLDCGDKDDYKLYVGTSQLYDALQARGIPSEYHLGSGNHSRTYWKSHIEDYLRFYAGIPS